MNGSIRVYRILLAALAVFLLIGLGAAIYLLVTLRPGAASVQPATPAATLAVDPVWERIQKSGNLRIGIAPEYPPFVYTNTSGNLDGLDIAVARSVGQKLGLIVQVTPVTFDGLWPALQSGEIDAAAGGITVTPERLEKNRYSRPYFTSTDAILARSDSQIPAQTEPAGLSGLKVGVERDTQYESWVREVLVKPGILPEDMLFRYHNLEAAVEELRNGHVDVVITDLPVAEGLIVDGDLRIVGQGLAVQFYYFGYAQNASRLQAEIDRALNALDADGTLESLARLYAGVPPAIPVTLEAPAEGGVTNTATPPDCVDGMMLVESLPPEERTAEDGRVRFLPGESFVQQWKIRNSGSCIWNSGYRLEFGTAEQNAGQFGAQSVRLPPKTTPGETIVVGLPLTAPLKTGIYRSSFQITDPLGMAFGSPLFLEILVSNDGVNTSSPPEIYRLWGAQESTNSGVCTKISWSVVGEVSQISIRRDGELLRRGAPQAGSLEDCLDDARLLVYTLDATGPNGITTQHLVFEVDDGEVVGSASPTEIKRFEVKPEIQYAGECRRLEWEIGGSVEIVQLFRNNTLIARDLPTFGGGDDCYTDSTDVVYRLEARDAMTAVVVERENRVMLDGAYTLTEMRTSTGEIFPPTPANALTLEIKDDQATGFAGCNRYRTVVTYAGSRFWLRELISKGNKLCSEPELVMELEQDYLELLEGVTAFRIIGERLELYGPPLREEATGPAVLRLAFQVVDSGRQE